jgi:hypothetical protein
VLDLLLEDEDDDDSLAVVVYVPRGGTGRFVLLLDLLPILLLDDPLVYIKVTGESMSSAERTTIRLRLPAELETGRTM